MAGFKSKLVPATIAASHWPACIAKMASCKQNNALEHAVSMATLGPVNNIFNLKTKNYIYSNLFLPLKLY